MLFAGPGDLTEAQDAQLVVQAFGIVLAGCLLARLALTVFADLVVGAVPVGQAFILLTDILAAVVSFVAV
jgi:hypothetical protein